MSDSNDTRHGRKKLRIACYHKLLKLCMKRYTVISKWTWMSCCVLQTLQQQLKKIKKKKHNWCSKKGDKMKSYKIN